MQKGESHCRCSNPGVSCPFDIFSFSFLAYHNFPFHCGDFRAHSGRCGRKCAASNAASRLTSAPPIKTSGGGFHFGFQPLRLWLWYYFEIIRLVSRSGSGPYVRPLCRKMKCICAWKGISISIHRLLFSKSTTKIMNIHFFALYKELPIFHVQCLI